MLMQAWFLLFFFIAKRSWATAAECFDEFSCLDRFSCLMFNDDSNADRFVTCHASVTATRPSLDRNSLQSCLANDYGLDVDGDAWHITDVGEPRVVLLIPGHQEPMPCSTTNWTQNQHPTTGVGEIDCIVDSIGFTGFSGVLQRDLTLENHAQQMMSITLTGNESETQHVGDIKVLNSVEQLTVEQTNAHQVSIKWQPPKHSYSLNLVTFNITWWSTDSEETAAYCQNKEEMSSVRFLGSEVISIRNKEALSKHILINLPSSSPGYITLVGRYNDSASYVPWSDPTSVYFETLGDVPQQRPYVGPNHDVIDDEIFLFYQLVKPVVINITINEMDDGKPVLLPLSGYPLGCARDEINAIRTTFIGEDNQLTSYTRPVEMCSLFEECLGGVMTIGLPSIGFTTRNNHLLVNSTLQNSLGSSKHITETNLLLSETSTTITDNSARLSDDGNVLTITWCVSNNPEITDDRVNVYFCFLNATNTTAIGCPNDAKTLMITLLSNNPCDSLDIDVSATAPIHQLFSLYAVRIGIGEAQGRIVWTEDVVNELSSVSWVWIALPCAFIAIIVLLVGGVVLIRRHDNTKRQLYRIKTEQVVRRGSDDTFVLDELPQVVQVSRKGYNQRDALQTTEEAKFENSFYQPQVNPTSTNYYHEGYYPTNNDHGTGVFNSKKALDKIQESFNDTEEEPDEKDSLTETWSENKSLPSDSPYTRHP